MARKTNYYVPINSFPTFLMRGVSLGTIGQSHMPIGQSHMPDGEQLVRPCDDNYDLKIMFILNVLEKVQYLYLY